MPYVIQKINFSHVLVHIFPICIMKLKHCEVIMVIVRGVYISASSLMTDLFALT